MTNDTYEKAKRLVEDIKGIDRQLREVEENNSWITISTPMIPMGVYSLQFEKDLVNWLNQIKKQYQKEFDELA